MGLFRIGGENPEENARPLASGLPVVAESINHMSGVPLGGIGSGSVEVRPDGYFHDWLIFNLGSWAPDQPNGEDGKQPEMGPGALAFFLRAQKDGGEPQLRRLGIREDQNDLYSLGWCKNVQSIRFQGYFPIAQVSYVDDSLPVEVTAEFFSPFIPHEASKSGTPGFHGLFTIRNTSPYRVDVSLMSKLSNPLAWGFSDRALENSVSKTAGGVALTMTTHADQAPKQTLGGLSMSLSGGEPSWVLGDFESYVSNGDWFGGSFGTVQDGYLRGFRTAGRLPSLSGAVCPAKSARFTNEEISAMRPDDAKKVIEQLGAYPSLASLIERIRLVDAKQFDSEEGLRRVVRELSHRLDHMAGKDRTDASWGHGALCSGISLAPGETKQIRFNLAWHFPHHFSGEGPDMGHMYENWFANAEEANRYMIENFEDHHAKVTQFARTLFDTSLPPEMASAWSAQLSTLNKCTWWTKDGRFAVWEGLGCCGFHTMDITYQGSFSILSLFPELQLSQMKMGADYQRADGRVAHFFTPDLLHVDNGFDRVDMNPQFVMLVCRDYLWTGDRSYLERVFPHVVRAIASIASLDANGDGLPDKDTRRNTYDNWNFFGTPSYISSLWLGALLAGERMARDLGKADLAEQWKSLLQKGRDTFERVLWNGDYFSLWVDGENRDECCMSDQLSGVWFSHLMGLEPAIDSARTRQALQAVLKHNFGMEIGLTNATYPAGTKPNFQTYENAQATANWTGVEYAFASALLDHGLFEPACNVIKSIHDRYLRAGRIWNHVECGDHYYRAMCSWSTLWGATGFRIDAPKKRVALTPTCLGSGVSELSAPWFAPTGYGSLRASKDQLEIACNSGSLTLKTLDTSLRNAPKRATLNGRVLEARALPPTTLEFLNDCTLRPGERLLVSV